MIEIKDYQEKAILKLKEQINELLNRESRECHNLCVLIQEAHELGISIDFDNTII